MFVATYSYTEDTAARDAVRAEHREYLAGLGERLVLSGPTDANGAVLVFDVPAAADVERILDADPFTRAGLVAARTVVGWTPVLGRLLPSL
ncbi:YciI family protein [Kineococcus xinjiangensis]|uniref:YciI family protein n=1 Tax=Kineococcus xinjiangensis TaxID=512762 RepID=UPI001B802747|nr:YciI family protein [Kineococcus xinjiangensis]